MIKDHIEISDGDLRNLAMERAQAVLNYITSQDYLPGRYRCPENLSCGTQNR